MTPPAQSPDSDSAKLASTRSISVAGDIDDKAAEVIMAKMLFLFDKDEKTPITLTIDSRGGLVTPVFAIVDSMRKHQPLIRTVCSGQASGVAAAILACGGPGKRWMAKTASVHLGPLQSAAATSSASSDLAGLEDAFVTMLAKCTGHDESKIREDMRAGRELDATASVTYGLADGVY